MKKNLFLFFIFLIPLAGYSQFELNESLNRNEFTGGIGLSEALTDIGGSPKVGSHFLGDLNLDAARYAGFLGYRRVLNRAFSIKGIITTGILYGNDDLSPEEYRSNRNQDFRTFIIEPSLQLEYHLFQYDDRIGNRYKLKHAYKFRKGGTWDAYIFAGIGGLYFNPQGKYNGFGAIPHGLNPDEWYNLHSLSTEGEGLPGGPPEYSKVAISIPIGIGIKYGINSNWSIGLELSDRIWTSTDYIDDAHGNYFSKQEIQQYKGSVAAYFSDPSRGLVGDQANIGAERASPEHDDTYMFLLFCINYHPNFLSKERQRVTF